MSSQIRFWKTYLLEGITAPIVLGAIVFSWIFSRTTVVSR